MINSRNIDDLKPDVADKCRAFVRACKNVGIDVIITSTYRDYESQNALYQQGRTTPGKKVTNASAGKSYHNHRVAFDFVPIVNGKAQWSDDATFEKCGIIAESFGLTWSGRWKGGFREKAHCQDTGGLTLAQLQALKNA
jgi:peptidoglycan L-alanyl-D-glutamate endopeptidase CwlK